MRGFPKTINTKADVAILQKGTIELGKTKNYYAEMEEYEKKMKENRFCWQVVKELAKDEVMVEDVDNKIIEEEQEDGKKKRIYIRKIEDTNANVFRLGLSKKVEIKTKEVKSTKQII